MLKPALPSWSPTTGCSVLYRLFSLEIIFGKDSIPERFTSKIHIFLCEYMQIKAGGHHSDRDAIFSTFNLGFSAENHSGNCRISGPCKTLFSKVC